MSHRWAYFFWYDNNKDLFSRDAHCMGLAIKLPFLSKAHLSKDHDLLQRVAFVE